MIDKSHLAQRQENIKKLATYLHSLDCHDPDCRWGCESWVFNKDEEEFNPSYCAVPGYSAKQRFYDKAEKIYNYFEDSYHTSKRVVDFMTSINADLAKNFIASI
jgi:hypothetical protein